MFQSTSPSTTRRNVFEWSWVRGYIVSIHLPVDDEEEPHHAQRRRDRREVSIHLPVDDEEERARLDPSVRAVDVSIHLPVDDEEEPHPAHTSIVEPPRFQSTSPSTTRRNAICVAMTSVAILFQSTSPSTTRRN